MEYIYIGKIVNTHGIKGEIKVISEFEYKDYVFKSGNYIYIGNKYEKEKIVTYRHHKIYDMITLEGYNNINQVLKFKNNKVYIKREEILGLSDKILKSDIIEMDAFIENEKIGTVVDIYKTGINYEIIEIKNDKNEKILIPYHKDFIKCIDIKNKKIIFNGGML